MMKKRILLGVDEDLSLATQQALRAVGDVFAQSSPHVSLTVLTVIPFVQTIMTTPGMFVGQALPLVATAEQRSQAEALLRNACLFLEQQGIEPECMQQMMRVGVPAEEIVKVARELHVHVIVVGSRGNTLWQHLRRWLLGSTSRRVLETAPCPVMIAGPVHLPRSTNLVTWYEQAVMNHLQEHPEALTVFTPQQVAQQFIPPTLQEPGRKEVAAATLALEQLVNSRILYRRHSQGELHYVND